MSPLLNLNVLESSCDLQERLTSSQLPLKNGGTKIAARIAHLILQIEGLKASLPAPMNGMRGHSTGQASMMVPINSPESKVWR